MNFRFKQGERPLPGYTVQRGVGLGGFGEVYHAVSDGGKEVALKFLRDNPHIELRGVQHVLNLKSPHLVAIHDVRQNDRGEWFVIMEYVSGPSLRDLLNEESGGLGAEKAAFFVREIARGLQYLHDRGIVHRDLKPGNIFYDEGYVKIGDYGLSKAMAVSQHSGQTMSVGSVHYMAPEIGTGDYSRTIDLYALGVMTYELLRGQVPYAGSSMGEVLMKHLTAQPEVDAFPEPFPRVIRKALAKDPTQRYQTAQEMVADLLGSDSLSRSLAGFDAMSLSQVASRAVAGKFAHAGFAGGTGGSSNSITLDARAARGAPPVHGDARGDGQRRGLSELNELGELRELQELRQLSQLRKLGSRGQDPRQAQGLAPLDYANDYTMPRKSRLTAGVLGVPLGAIGAHRFYLGHTGIGVAQLLVTMFTGVGALWGIIEGFMILMGADYRDSLGRPLVDAPPGERSMVARGAWGLGSAVALLGSVALLAAGTFAAGNNGLDRLNYGREQYFFNPFKFMYFPSALLICASGFFAWKASHRSGLPTWRATMRPLLVSGFSFLSLVMLVLWQYFTVGPWQVITSVMFIVLLAAAIATFLVHGPPVTPRQGDAYWQSVYARVCIGVTLACGLMAAGCLIANRTSKLSTSGGVYYIGVDEQYMHSNGGFVEIPQNAPTGIVLAVAFAGIGCGAVAEGAHRRQEARRIQQLLGREPVAA